MEDSMIHIARQTGEAEDTEHMTKIHISSNIFGVIGLDVYQTNHRTHEFAKRSNGVARSI